MLGARLMTFHNLWFMHRFMKKIRSDIDKDKKEIGKINSEMI